MASLPTERKDLRGRIQVSPWNWEPISQEFQCQKQTCKAKKSNKANSKFMLIARWNMHVFIKFVAFLQNQKLEWNAKYVAFENLFYFEIWKKHG